MIHNYNMGTGTKVEGQVTELHLESNAVAQISETPDGEGFLIRVWPANGTREYGGNNSTIVSLSVVNDKLMHLDINGWD